MSDYIPPEIPTKILSSLPPKSLLKFRCVCKSWRSLITSPDFITKHLNQTKTNKLLLVRYLSSPSSRNEQYLLRFDDESFDGYAKFKGPFKTNVYFRIVGICNGLICLCDDRFGSTNTVIIWNLSIHRYISLPNPKISLLSHGIYMFALGFGFDSRKNDYKVVRLAYLKEIQMDQFAVYINIPIVEIYAVSTCSWRTMKNGVLPPVGVGIVQFFWEQVFLNGSVHWLAYKKDDNGVRNLFLSFDITEEKFGVMEFPVVLAKVFPENFSVGLHKESLALFVYNMRRKCTSFEVYVMKEYGVVESWSKMFKVADFECGISVLPGFREDGELLVVTQANELVSYEPNSKRTKKLGIRGVKESVYAGPYAESLVLLNGLEGRLTRQVKSYKKSVASKSAAKQKRTLDEDEIEYLLDMRYTMVRDAQLRDSETLFVV